jgi:hypothetical protein
MSRVILLFMVLIGISHSSFSQKYKVKRKGVDPMDVTKASGKTSSNPKMNYSLSQFNGKWQEVRRTQGNKSVSFIDTLQLQVKNDSLVTMRDGVHLAINGNLYFDGTNTANIAGDPYTIVSMNKSRLVLNDGNVTRHMQKVPSFYWESFGNLEVKQEKFETPIQPASGALAGKWIVYRRDAPPGTSHDRDLIRYIDIKKINADGSYSGEVNFYDENKAQTAPAKFAFVNNELQITTDQHSWVVSVYKAEGNQIVFGDKKQLMYFAKKI